jgi:hypothetical protein
VRFRRQSAENERQRCRTAPGDHGRWPTASGLLKVGLVARARNRGCSQRAPDPSRRPEKTTYMSCPCQGGRPGDLGQKRSGQGGRKLKDQAGRKIEEIAEPRR